MSHHALPHCSRRIQLLAVALTVVCQLAVLRPAAAQNLLFTFSGNYDPNNSYNGGFAYDGTNYTELPQILDLDALQGGTFTASFTVPVLPVPISQTATHASYMFGPASTIQFTLFDGAGNAKYYSNNGQSSFIPGDVYKFPNSGGTANQLVYAAIGGFDVLGMDPALPGTTPFDPISQFNFSNYSDPLTTPITDLSFITNPATFLSFHERMFNVEVAYGDGDLDNGIGPFRFFDTSAYYTVNTVQITAVPEPGTYGLIAGMLAPGAAFLIRRRRKQVRRAESLYPNQHCIA